MFIFNTKYNFCLIIQKIRRRLVLVHIIFFSIFLININNKKLNNKHLIKLLQQQKTFKIEMF